MSEPKERYVVVKHLAEGGMANVFLARDTRAVPPRLVVLKRLLPELKSQPDHVAMFLDESDLAMRLSHPSIVRALDRGSTKDDGPFLVLEYLAGFDLDLVIDRLRKTGAQMPWALAVRVVTAVAHAMSYAHALTGVDGRPLGLVHRDLTPSNVFLTFDGLVKVIDFGIARAAERRTRTSTGMLKGKARYLAPEQIQNLPLDGRADQFALGAALYEALTLQPLFQGDSELAVIHAIIEQRPPTLSALRRDVPELLDVVFETMTAQLREERYPTMQAVAEALEVVVPPADWRGELSAFMREHFGADFEAHATLMARLASATTSELKAFFEKGVPLEGAPRDQKTLPVKNPQIPPEARRTPLSPVDIPLELPGAEDPGPLSLPGEESVAPPLPGLSPAARAGVPAPEPGLDRRTIALVAGGAALAVLAGVVGLRSRKPAAPGTGGLFVRSSPPGATIVLDGRPLSARTPTAIAELSVGGHRLELTHPDALPALVSVDIKPGERATVDVELPSREGTLTFHVSPATAVVLVDGREVPLDGGVGRSEPLRAGPHDVVIRALGYQQQTLTAEAADGRHDTLRFDLEPEVVPVATPTP